MSDEDAATADIVSLTADLLSAYVTNNRVNPAELPDLIASTHAAFAALGSSAASNTLDEVTRPTPAQIRKSITDNGLISFEDGRSYKMLKRHLTQRGLTPAEYRAKWGLPPDYPMTAPAYSAARSALAKRMGLGAKGRKAATKSRASRKAKA